MMKLIITYWVILSTALLAVGNDFDRIFEKYLAGDCLITEFKQVIRQGNSDQKTISEGKLFFKKENNFRVEYGRGVIVSNGKEIWNYDKELNRVVINAVTDDQSLFNIRQLLEGFKKDYSVEIIKPGKELLLTSESSNFSSVRLLYTSNFVIEKMEIWDSMGNTIYINLSATEFDKNLNDNSFSFVPPQGSRIVDLR